MRLSAMKKFQLLLALFFVSVIGGCSADDPPTPTQSEVEPPATGTKAVSVTSYPGQIPADGISSALIIATCTVGGEQAPNNLPVRFSADAGDFSLNGIDPIDATTPTRSYQLYTAGGQSSIYLLSDESPYVATVLARFGNEASATVNVKFVRRDQDVGDVVLTLDPESGTAPLTVLVEASVLSRSGEALSEVKVEFTCSDGKATIDSKKVTTDSDGKASTFIREISKDATITATAGSTKAKELVEITNEEAKSLSLEAIGSTGSAISEPVLINNNASLLLRATVSSESSGGVPVPNVNVTFSSTDSGASFSQNPVTTNSNGEAETFVNNIDQDSTITARTKNANDTLAVRINKPPVAVINLLSGTPTPDEVNVLVFTASSSYDPDAPFGDKITFSWTFSINSTANEVTLTQSTSTDKTTVTLTVGSSSGTPGDGLPAADDVLTIVLTVQDSNGLTSNDVMTITF
jgi:hypothetical protein